MLDDEGYVWKESFTLKRVKIPEGFIKCSECHGTGKQIKIFKDPGPNEYMTCLKCMGKGYVRKTNTGEETK